MALTPDQLNFWTTNGYLAIEGVLSLEEVERLREALDRLAVHARG